MQTKTTIALATGALALAAPGAAQAHHGAGDPAGAHGACHGPHGQGFGRGFFHHGRARGFGAVVASTDATAKTVTVTVGARAGTRHHGAGGDTTTPKTLVLDVSAARLEVADTNGDGTPNEIADLKAGDKVLVKLARDADKTAPTVATKALFDWSAKSPAVTTKARRHHHR